MSTQEPQVKQNLGPDVIRRRKIVLLVLLSVSAGVPLAFIRYNEPTAIQTITKVLAKTGSLVGTVLLVWQLILGFRIVSTLFHRDLLWLVKLHERLGAAAILLILLHPIFIPIYYAIKFDRSVLGLDLSDPFYWFVLAGMATMALLLFIFVTSVFFRKKLGYGRWFATHLTTYLVLPLAFVHAFPIGMTLRETPLNWYWMLLAAVAGAVILARLLNVAGWRAYPHEVTNAHKLSEGVTELTMLPRQRPMEPHPGQFVYIRRRKAGSQRPYSVVRYDSDSGEISIAARAGRDFSVRLQSVQPSERMYLDGPYGVFGQEALRTDRPLVMAAGGIGITAFLWMLETIEQNHDRPAYLFYGNLTTDRISYRRELDALRYVRVVHVISHQPDYPGEKGFITVELMRRYVGRELSECEVLICGPPVMTEKLETQLLEAGVPTEQIHHELFGF
ncbi:MAG: ferric reductase-like transmembrane domain-containing protein [Planctomycetota bacterium]